MSISLNTAFVDPAKFNSMTSEFFLARLYHYANKIAQVGTGTIVEIGAYRGASTVALGMGVRDAGRGHVYSIDPHKDFHGLLGGVFCPTDHAVFESTIQKYNLVEWVTHYCTNSAAVAKEWTKKIDLLWIDGDPSYEGVTTDLKLWLPFVADGGIVVLDDHSPGSEVEEAVRDHLSFSHFMPIERIENAIVLQKTAEPRTMIICGGMQSSGSTLVSMCFLQRSDLDGVYDLDNPFIQQDFSRVFTSTAWVKMTIGSFRLRELVDFYTAQGWLVRPLLIYRDPEDIIASLVEKWYGLDGCTGDDPPLFIRLARYRADIEDAKSKGWPVLNYTDLLHTPEEELSKVCTLLNLPWDPQMMTWPKSESDFAYPSLGNVSLRNSLVSGSGLVETIDRYKTNQINKKGLKNDSHVMYAKVLVTCFHRIMDGVQANCDDLGPSCYRGTRRDVLERKIRQINEENKLLRDDLGNARIYISRIMKHPIIGLLIKLWSALVNPSFKKPT